ncbi:alpha beta-hydrolase [Coniophora puteana RWD-64-598 SS2]|uniref:Alpha beta-hydrolase n=1 Tax=Coniophora puteana (strain RWD-64-598) TaxID=741705 RepID=A0A5M3MXL4_CONPW|nr:alpha beta-hydrolase [Coniophora puteana RWD-64-598 SS2]EIW83903.1 alpha beta-hydrolase [Coniophora puteana RWD-64-598 SS2]
MASPANVSTVSGARSIWGSPDASRRALLLHGLACSSYTMRHIGEGLAQHGYLVSAPDLPGHGIGPRAETYTWASMTSHVVSLLRETTYDLIVGHSMGAILALRALSELSPAYNDRPSSEVEAQRALGLKGHPRVVLLDPPLSFSEAVLESNAALFGSLVRSPPEPAFYSQMFPRWTKLDAVFQVFANELCDDNIIEIVYETHQVNHLELLDHLPAHVQFVVLVGDPDSGGQCLLSDVERVPNLEMKMMKGYSHWIPYECPEEVVKAAV